MPKSSAAPRSSGVTAPRSPNAGVSTSPLVAPRARGGGSGAHASTESLRASTTLPHALATPNPLPVPRGKPSSLDSTQTASTPESDASVHDSPSPQVVLVHLRKSTGAAKPSAGAKPPAGATPRGAKTAGPRPAAVGKSKASRIPVLSPEQPAADAATVRFQGHNNNRQAEAANAEAAAAAAAGAEAEACNEAAAAAAGVERQCAESKAESKVESKARGRAVQHAMDASSQASRRGVRKSPAGEHLTARSTASHSPPLAARTGAGPPTATVSRLRSTPGSYQA